jgi:alkylation response protein AidB-like acyl-CoA dehydrogenase
MNENVARPIALAQEAPAFELNPNAHRIASDQEALAVARELAAEFAQEAAQRDRDRRLPAKELDRFSGSGLWGITVPKAYGGAGVSFATLAEVIAIISAADPSLGQLPQNHLAALDAIRVTASEEQKRLWFGRALQGYRLGNAFSEAKSKHVGAFETTIKRDGGSFVVNGEKFYATGALFAHFIHIGAVNEDGNVHLAIAPRAAPGLTIIDNWSSFGQRTTASGNVLIDNVRVGPEAVIPAYLGGERPSIGDLEVKLHAAEALLERAGRAIDGILEDPSEEAVAETAVKVAEAKVLTTEIAILATNKLHELGGTRSTLGQYNLDRHWRNARTHTLHDPVRWKYFHVGNYLLNGVAPPRHAWS